MMKTAMRTLLILLLCIASHAAIGAERWRTLPAPPTVAMATQGRIEVGGVRLWYASTGSGSPVLLLHGGLGSSDDWGNQVAALAAHHRVIVLDARGQGRSTRDDTPYSYNLLADDVVALLDALKIDRADVVGWSDGANTGLDLAMRHPQRIGKLFAFGANASVSGMAGEPDKQPIFPQLMQRMSADYTRLSPTPGDFEAVADKMGAMWATQPEWTDAQLATIKAPVWIVDGDHEEFIRREHTEHLADSIPGAGLLILPDASHFAPLQAPALFSAAVLQFLDGD
jgi:pimeloyl-ACP methyl ester carboxylesterase